MSKTRHKQRDNCLFQWLADFRKKYPKKNKIINED